MRGAHEEGQELVSARARAFEEPEGRELPARCDTRGDWRTAAEEEGETTPLGIHTGASPNAGAADPGHTGAHVLCILVALQGAP